MRDAHSRVAELTLEKAGLTEIIWLGRVEVRNRDRRIAELEAERDQLEKASRYWYAKLCVAERERDQLKHDLGHSEETLSRAESVLENLESDLAAKPCGGPCKKGACASLQIDRGKVTRACNVWAARCQKLEGDLGAMALERDEAQLGLDNAQWLLGQPDHVVAKSAADLTESLVAAQEERDQWADRAIKAAEATKGATGRVLELVKERDQLRNRIDRLTDDIERWVAESPEMARLKKEYQVAHDDAEVKRRRIQAVLGMIDNSLKIGDWPAETLGLCDAIRAGLTVDGIAWWHGLKR